MKLKLVFLSLLVILSTANAQNQIKLEEHIIKLQNRNAFKIKVPVGYNISVAAEGLKRSRFFSKSPDEDCSSPICLIEQIIRWVGFLY